MTLPGKAQSAERASFEDFKIIKTVTASLLASRSLTLGKRTLIVANHTLAKSGMLSDDQMSQYIGSHKVETSVVRDMQRRNQGGGTDIKAFRAGTRQVQLGDLIFTTKRGDQEMIRSDEFEERFPNADAWILLWLPGYSNDGSEAAVRFMYGPTTHGGIGTFGLKKMKSGWTVAWSTLQKLF